MLYRYFSHCTCVISFPTPVALDRQGGDGAGGFSGDSDHDLFLFPPHQEILESFWTRDWVSYHPIL